MLDKREIITGDWLLQLGFDDNGIRSHKYTKVSSMDHNGLELGIGIKDLKKTRDG